MKGITTLLLLFFGLSPTHGQDADVVAHEIIMGKTAVGDWKDRYMCAWGVRITGFRLKVEPPIHGDDTALNGFQLACADGSVTHEFHGYWGVWKDWQYCDGKLVLRSSFQISTFNVRSEPDQGAGDDTGVNNVKMMCNNKIELDGGGNYWGSWEAADASCPKDTYFCGIQPRIQPIMHAGDDQSVSQLKFLCCRPRQEVIITESYIMGKTRYGKWTKTVMCESYGKVVGFRLRVEDPIHGDDTALNGIQLKCFDGSTREEIIGLYGVWKPWKTCEAPNKSMRQHYVNGFNMKSEGEQHGGDDTAGNDVKMRCTNRVELEGEGGRWGTWEKEGYKECPSQSFLCGVQARIEGDQAGGDDTALNQIKFICCKVEAEQCPVLVEPLGCFKDDVDERVMPTEILNERDPSNSNFVHGGHFIDWYNFPKYLPAFRCRCAVKAASLGYMAFGIQMFAECWTGPRAHLDYNKYGNTEKCVDTNYEYIAHELQECPVQTGVSHTFFAYRISSVQADCSTSYTSVGCFEDFMDVPRPVPNYQHNERDPSAPGFNNIYIDWKNWNVYHKQMICRCAEAAKKKRHDIFSLQFWGECWTSFRNETEYDRDGRSTRCRGKDFKPCPCNSFHCVGMHQANYVFRLTQL